jgi:hypothetical protein
MEPLWRPGLQPVAAAANAQAQKRRRQAKTVAAGCYRLPRGAHGKEGVGGSSPSEGSAKSLLNRRLFSRLHLQSCQRAPGMEPFMESRFRTASSKSRN